MTIFEQGGPVRIRQDAEIFEQSVLHLTVVDGFGALTVCTTRLASLCRQLPRANGMLLQWSGRIINSLHDGVLRSGS